MENRMEELLKKYGTISQLLERATMAEKDNFLLNRLLLLESYNERPLGNRHALDTYIRSNYSKEKEEVFLFDDKDYCLSPFSELTFQGSTNVVYPEYDLDPFSRVGFSSMIQFFDFHSAMLFLDRELAGSIAESKEYSKKRISHSSINNFDIRLWSRYRIKIMVEAIKSAFSTNVAFANALNSSSRTRLVYSSDLDFWGGKENYWGKALTRERDLMI